MAGRRTSWVLASTLAALVAATTATQTMAVEPISAEDVVLAGDPEVQLTVVTARAWVANGRVYVSGEIRNTTSQRVNGWGQVRVQSDATGSNQLVLAWASTYVLAPGARSAFFKSETTLMGTDARMTLATAGGIVVPDPGGAIGVSTYGDVFSDTGTGDTVRVQVRNTTSRPVRLAYVVAVFRGSDGKVTNFGWEFKGRVLAPGEVAEGNALSEHPSAKLAVSATAEVYAKFDDLVQEQVVSWQNWFQDIDGSSLKTSIAWLAEQGITAGCAPYRYCPTASVTRAQMALFLTRAIKPPLPTTTTDYFDDDDGKTGEAAINRLAAAGIAGGCGPRRFCPTAYVTRAQMALFLGRAWDFPSTSTDFFDDDDGKTGEAAINRLAAAKITSGCGTRRYCPSAYVTRAQMAAFLKRVLD